MPDPKDETPDFDELKMPGDDPPAAQPSDASDPSEQDLAPLTDEDATPESEQPEAEQPQAEDQPKKKGRRKKEKKKKPRKEKKKPRMERRPRDGEDEEEKTGGLMKAVAETSPYTVMLALALLAIVIAVFCLFKELERHNFEIKADKARTAVMLPAAQFPRTSTIEAA